MAFPFSPRPATAGACLALATLALAGLALATLAGCDSTSASASAGNSASAQINDAPRAGDPLFGGRAPRSCPSIKRAPSAAEAAALIQCTMEGNFGTISVFLTGVNVQMGSSRPFDIHQDVWAQGIDPRTTIYNLTASAHNYTCSRTTDLPAGHNCTIAEYTSAPGHCWKSTTGDFRCSLQGGTTGFNVNQPPPTTF